MTPGGGFFAAAHRPALASYYTEVMADSPAMYYPLGDTASPAVDVTGNTSQSSIGGVTFGAAGMGDAATSVSMTSATAAAIRVSHSGILTGLTALTIEMIVARTSTGNMTSFSLTSNTGEVGFIGIGSSIPRTVVWNSDGTTTVSVSDPAGALANNTPTHLAMTWSSNTLRLYKNGTLVNSAATTGLAPTASAGSTTTIGQRVAAAGQSWIGRMAGMAAYPTALSAGRLLAHAQAAGLA